NDRLIRSRRESATKTRVRGGGEDSIGGDPIDSGDDTGCGSRALAVQHPHGNETYVLRYTVLHAADSSGDVGAMSVAVGRAAPNRHLVDARCSATTKIDVTEVDAGVDDVNGDVAAVVGVGVSVVKGQCALIDAVDSPCCGRLDSDCSHHLVGFHALD